MTNNAPHQPNVPHFDSAARGVYNPVTLGGPGNHQPPSGPLFLETPMMRLLVALLFAVIFGIAWARPEFGPLTMLVVVGCLLYRLEPWQRHMAAAPLVLAAVRFYLLLPNYAQSWSAPTNPYNFRPGQVAGVEFGIPWMPAFLSVCLFFLPRKHSVTLKIVIVEALAIILSSLLPGMGFLAILGAFHYTLFFVITIGLFLDLRPGLHSIFAESQAHSLSMPERAPVTPPPSRPAM